ncbi:MAG: ParA family protein [Chloroflexi bacterium]|nr:ParA family protein [Chloroflexota bacterium]
MGSGSTRVVAIANGKGGVGKTSTTYALGDALADAGQRVLMVDLDPQSSLTLAAGQNPVELELTVYSALVHWIKHYQPLALASYRLTLREGLDLLPANLDLLQADDDLATAKRRENVLDNVLTPAHGQYDVVLIDCPPSLSLLVTNAFTAAQQLLVPVSPEFLAISGLNVLFRKIEELRASGLNPRLSVAGLVLTMVDHRTTHSREMQQLVIQQLARFRLLGEIKRTTAINQAAAAGLPITRYQPAGEAAQAYRQVARTLLADWGRGPRGEAAAATPAGDQAAVTVPPLGVAGHS